jgi:hypothetical protein
MTVNNPLLTGEASYSATVGALSVIGTEVIVCGNGRNGDQIAKMPPKLL